MIKIQEAQKKIEELEKKKQKLLNKLYELGLAPFYGYYEKRLRQEDKQ